MLISNRAQNEEVDYQDYHTIPRHDNSNADNSIRVRNTRLYSASLFSANCESGGWGDGTGIADRRSLHRSATCCNLSCRYIAPESI